MPSHEFDPHLPNSHGESQRHSLSQDDGSTTRPHWPGLISERGEVVLTGSEWRGQVTTGCGPVRLGSLHLHRTAADMGCQDVARPTNGREGSLATRPFRSWPAGIPRRTPLPLVSPGASWRRMELRPSILDELTVFSDYITRLFDLYCNFQILYYVLLTFFYGDALEGVSCRWKRGSDWRRVPHTLEPAAAVVRPG